MANHVREMNRYDKAQRRLGIAKEVAIGVAWGVGWLSAFGAGFLAVWLTFTFPWFFLGLASGLTVIGLGKLFIDYRYVKSYREGDGGSTS